MYAQKYTNRYASRKLLMKWLHFISIIAARIAQENYSNYTVINFNDYDSNYFII